MLTYSIRELMRENALDLVSGLLVESIPFRLVLWNNDDWDAMLPEFIMESFPVQLVLDIRDVALDDSFIDENTGEINIVTSFEGHVYTKILQGDEIMGILDLTGQPYIINSFEMDRNNIENNEDMILSKPTSINEWIKLAKSGGIKEEDAERSINAFIKNNKHLKDMKKD